MAAIRDPAAERSEVAEVERHEQALDPAAGRESPLWCAARGGQLDTVRLLVELGADVHARHPAYHSPPLGAANYTDQRDVVEYLMQFAPIWDAVKYGGLDRVRTLLRENPECVNARDEEGRTALHCPYWGARHGNEMLDLLIAHGANINARDNAGRNPIDQLLQNGRRVWRRFCAGTAENPRNHCDKSPQPAANQKETPRTQRNATSRIDFKSG